MAKIGYNFQRKLHETRAEQIRIEMEIEDLRDAGYAFEKTSNEGEFCIFTVMQDGRILFEWSDEVGFQDDYVLPNLPRIVEEVLDKMTTAHKKWLGSQEELPKTYRTDEFGIDWSKV